MSYANLQRLGERKRNYRSQHRQQQVCDHTTRGQDSLCKQPCYGRVRRWVAAAWPNNVRDCRQVLLQLVSLPGGPGASIWPFCRRRSC